MDQSGEEICRKYSMVTVWFRLSKEIFLSHKTVLSPNQIKIFFSNKNDFRTVIFGHSQLKKLNLSDRLDRLIIYTKLFYPIKRPIFGHQEIKLPVRLRIRSSDRFLNISLKQILAALASYLTCHQLSMAKPENYSINIFS